MTWFVALTVTGELGSCVGEEYNAGVKIISILFNTIWTDLATCKIYLTDKKVILEFLFGLLRFMY